MVVVLWLVLLMRVVRRGSMDGRPCAVLCAGVTGRAVGAAGEQRHEADRDDRTDLSGPPAQLGKPTKSSVPRGVSGMAGPDRIAGVGIEVCPALAPEGRRGRGIGRLAGQSGVALVGVVGRPIGRTALLGPTGRRTAVGVTREVVLSCPVSRAEPRGLLSRGRWPGKGPWAGRSIGPNPALLERSREYMGSWLRLRSAPHPPPHSPFARGAWALAGGTAGWRGWAGWP
jgi:hypothetical protein